MKRNTTEGITQRRAMCTDQYYSKATTAACNPNFCFPHERLHLSLSNPSRNPSNSLSQFLPPTPISFRTKPTSQRPLSCHSLSQRPQFQTQGLWNSPERVEMPLKAVSVWETKKRYLGEEKGFVEEMRFVAMKLHTRDQAKEGEKKDPDVQPLAKWEPSIEGYIRFLVDSKVVYDTLESIVNEAAYPVYAEFRNTGLERSEKLSKDLEWFKEQGHAIPEPSSPGTSYASYLKELSEKVPPAFICHFYNVYFAHTAGGRMIGKKVAGKILDNKQLEFYKWDGDFSQLLQNAREKLNRVTQSWSREEKDHCLEETEKSFKYSGEILRLIVS